MPTKHVGVKRLSIDHPQWIPVVQACYLLAKQMGDDGFAGRWVLNELNRRSWPGMTYGGETAPWLPNLRVLVRYEILKHRDTTRGGRRAYYTMQNPEGVRAALLELGADPL